jgi:hypothetical protein
MNLPIIIGKFGKTLKLTSLLRIKSKISSNFIIFHAKNQAAFYTHLFDSCLQGRQVPKSKKGPKAISKKI